MVFYQNSTLKKKKKTLLNTNKKTPNLSHEYKGNYTCQKTNVKSKLKYQNKKKTKTKQNKHPDYDEFHILTLSQNTHGSAEAACLQPKTTTKTKPDKMKTSFPSSQKRKQ